MRQLPTDGRRRVVIESVTPQVDGGRFAVKRVVGDILTVEADAFTDGHDEIRLVLLWRDGDAETWRETAMEPLGNDRWRGSFPVAVVGRYEYSIAGWVDHWETWRHDLKKRVDAGQDVDGRPAHRRRVGGIGRWPSRPGRRRIAARRSSEPHRRKCAAATYWTRLSKSTRTGASRRRWNNGWP